MLPDGALDADAEPEGNPGLDEPDRQATGPRFERWAAWLMAVGGGIGLVAAFDLTVEKIKLIEDPNYVPSCSINPILACGSVMKTHQASVFGFPNSLLGIIGFTLVTTLGVLLVGRVRLPQWVWWGLQVGVVLGVVFIHWLSFQSLYRIGALCPYCMVVWTVTLPIAWYVTMRNLQAWCERRDDGGPAFARIVLGAHGVLLAAWYVVFLVQIFARFSDYWLSLV